MDAAKIQNAGDILKIPLYASVAPSKKLKIKDILGREIIIWTYRASNNIYSLEGDPNSYKFYTIFEFSFIEHPERRFIISTSSHRILQDLTFIETALPVRTRIQEITLLHGNVPTGKTMYCLT